MPHKLIYSYSKNALEIRFPPEISLEIHQGVPSSIPERIPPKSLTKTKSTEIPSDLPL